MFLHVKEAKYIKLQTPSKQSKTVSAAGNENAGKQLMQLESFNTIISRGMDNKHLVEFKKKGVDVFITFNTRAKEAVSAYLREKLISH